jgi:hypothetical protein
VDETSTELIFGFTLVLRGLGLGLGGFGVNIYIHWNKIINNKLMQVSLCSVKLVALSFTLP